MGKKKKQKAEKSEEKMEQLEKEEIDIPQQDENSEQETPMENETKAQKFKRLAEKRVSRCLVDLKSIAKLNNKNNYEYKPEQIDQIVKALKENITLMESKFKNSNKEKPSFQF